MIGRDEDCPSEDCPKVRPKYVIGQDEDGPSEDRPKVRPKDVIGRDKDGPSEDRSKVLPKDFIGRDEYGLSEDCPKVRLKDSDWTKEETCPYDDVSDLSSCQTDLIGRDGIWSYLLGRF